MTVAVRNQETINKIEKLQKELKINTKSKLIDYAIENLFTRLLK